MFLSQKNQSCCCFNGSFQNPLLEAEDRVLTCMQECPPGFWCEHSLRVARVGICCPNFSELQRIAATNPAVDDDEMNDGPSPTATTKNGGKKSGNQQKPAAKQPTAPPDGRERPEREENRTKTTTTTKTATPELLRSMLLRDDVWGGGGPVQHDSVELGAGRLHQKVVFLKKISFFSY